MKFSKDKHKTNLLLSNKQNKSQIVGKTDIELLWKRAKAKNEIEQQLKQRTIKTQIFV